MLSGKGPRPAKVRHQRSPELGGAQPSPGIEPGAGVQGEAVGTETPAQRGPGTAGGRHQNPPEAIEVKRT